MWHGIKPLGIHAEAAPTDRADATSKAQNDFHPPITISQYETSANDFNSSLLPPSLLLSNYCLQTNAYRARDMVFGLLI